MDMTVESRSAIRLGSFSEDRMESDFRAYELDAGYRSLHYILPLLGVIFLAFSLPDLYALGWGTPFRVLLLARAAFCALALLAPKFLRPGVPVVRRDAVLGMITAVGIGAFGFAIFIYRDQNFYLQAMSILLMTSAQFLVPNRFTFSVAAALSLVAIGIASLEARTEAIPVATWLAFVVYYFLMALLSSIAALRTCRAKRREYSKTLELERISKTDQLTGLGNRRYLADRLAEAHARSSRYGETYALILVDLDRFKTLNDNYGHEAGDEALKEASRRLAAVLRSEDSLSRWGGEEFIILLAYATVEAALESARRLRTVLGSTPMPLVGTVTASFGVTLLRPGESTDDAIVRADVALYRAKDAGRDRVEFEP